MEVFVMAGISLCTACVNQVVHEKPEEQMLTLSFGKRQVLPLGRSTYVKGWRVEIVGWGILTNSTGFTFTHHLKRRYYSESIF
jgi:hypothetical protein